MPASITTIPIAGSMPIVRRPAAGEAGTATAPLGALLRAVVLALVASVGILVVLPAALDAAGLRVPGAS